MLVRSGAIAVLVVDSVAALVPKAEIESEMGDSHVGLQARLLSQAMRKLTGAIKQTNCQIGRASCREREEISVVGAIFISLAATKEIVFAFSYSGSGDG